MTRLLSTSGSRPAHEWLDDVLHSPSDGEPGHDRSQPPFGRFVRWAVTGALLFVSVSAAINLYVDPLGITGARRFPVAENNSVRVRKVALIDRLGTSPDVLILGSSRAMKIDPNDAFDVAQRTAFNAAVSGGKPVDAYVFERLVDRRFGPRRFPHIVYALDVESFRDKPIDTALLQNARLRRELPLAERLHGFATAYAPLIQFDTTRVSLTLVTRRLRGRESKASSGFAAPLSARGFQRWENVDRSEPVLDRRISRQMATYERLVYGGEDGFHRLEHSPQEYFERTLRLANDRGDTPTVFLTPFHPRAWPHLRGTGASARRREVIRYVRRLRHRYRFRFLDLSDVSSFGGDPDEFYDGVHMKVSNTRRLLAYLDRRGAL